MIFRKLNEVANNARKETKQTILKLGNWSFIDNTFSRNNDGGINDSIQNVLTHFESCIIDNYQDEIFTIDSSDIKFNPNRIPIDSEQKRFSTVSTINNLIDHINSVLMITERDEFSFKVDADDKTYYVAISTDYTINSKGMCCIEYNDKNMTVKGSVCKLGIYSNMEIEDIFLIFKTPFVMCKRDKDIYNTLTDEYQDNLVPDSLVWLLRTSLSYISKHIEMYVGNQTYPILCRSEKFFIQKLITNCLNNGEKFMYGIGVYTSKDVEDNEYISDLSSVYKAIHKPLPSFPLLDLTRNDLEHLRKYVNKVYLSDNVMNLKTYLQFPYGKIYRMEVYDDKHSYESLIMIDDSNVGNDLLRIIITINVTNDIIFTGWVDFQGLEEFDLSKVIASMGISYRDANGIELMNSLTEVKSLIPMGLLNQKELSSIAFDVIALNVLLYDKPDKYRVIEEYTKSSSNSNGEYIIKKILKSKNEAKKYIAELKKSGKHCGAEYVMESWHRKGYYRKTSTGHVWVEPTTCYRHLPLSEKEIHIQM